MLTQRGVVHWLVLTAIMLMIIGVSTYQRSAIALVLLAAGLQMRSEWRYRQQVERQLRDALASVERQVAERTEALTEARRVAEEASQLKDEFLATASHELRTPLNAIVGWIHVLQLGSVIDEAQRRHAMAAIARNATIQTRVIEDLLDVSRLMQGRVSLTVAPIDAGAVVDAAVDGVMAPAAEPMFQRLHVLVAEDDADSAAAVTAILRLHGCETQTAGTASECLRITAEWPTDVLVCDIGLPDDDGYGLLKRLRSRPDGQRIPAIALTAYARPEDRARALAAGFHAHLSKPLNPGSLLREISLAISAAPA